MKVIWKYIVVGLIVRTGVIGFAVGTDDQVEDAIWRSYHVTAECLGSGVDARESMRTYAMNLCDGDTNRFVRVLKDMASRCSTKEAMFIVQDIGVYGSASDMPFLRSMVTNVHAAATAVMVMSELGSITSNDVCLAFTVMGNPLVRRSEKERLCVNLWQRACRSGFDSNLSSFVKGTILNYVAASSDNAGNVDCRLVNIDSGYRWSKCRLTVLRSATSLELNELHRAYITNAINELIAYPESALND